MTASSGITVWPNGGEVGVRCGIATSCHTLATTAGRQEQVIHHAGALICARFVTVLLGHNYKLVVRL